MSADRWSSVEIFVRVVATGSFTSAATALGISRSQASRGVQTLEDRLGARLLHRTTRSVALTDAGAAFYERASRLLGDLDEAEALVTNLQAEPRGTLRVSVPMSFGVRYLAPAFAAFLRGHPDLTIEASYTDRRVDLLEEGVDLAVRVGLLEDSSLIARRLAPTTRRVVASPAYLAARGTPTRPEELRDHSALLYTLQTSGPTWLFQGPEGEVGVRVTGRLVTNSGEALLEAARAGLGLAMLPDFLVADDLASGALVSVLDPWAHRGLAIWALYPPGRHLAPKVRRFVDFLAKRFETCPPWAHGQPHPEGAGPLCDRAVQAI